LRKIKKGEKADFRPLLLNDLGKLNTAGSLATSEVIIVGKFEYVGENCVSSPHLLSNARLEQAMPIKVKYVNQDSK